MYARLVATIASRVNFRLAAKLRSVGFTRSTYRTIHTVSLHSTLALSSAARVNARLLGAAATMRQPISSAFSSPFGMQGLTNFSRSMSTASIKTIDDLIRQLQMLNPDERIHCVKKHTNVIRSIGDISAVASLLGDDKYRLFSRFNREYYHSVIGDLGELGNVLCVFPKEEQLALLQMFSSEKLCDFMLSYPDPLRALADLAKLIDSETMSCLFGSIFGAQKNIDEMKKCFQHFILEVGTVDEHLTRLEHVFSFLPEHNYSLLFDWIGSKNISSLLEKLSPERRSYINEKLNLNTAKKPPSSKPLSPEKVLGVSKDASVIDIKKAFAKWILKTHPDLNLENDKRTTEERKEATDELITARNALLKMRGV